MRLEIDVTDQLTPAIQQAIEKNASYQKRLTNSIGWWYQNQVKKVYWEDTTTEWEERIPYNIRKALNENAPRKWYGKMKQAIGYAKFQGFVDVGWTSSTSAKYGRMQEGGYERAVTGEVRKKWIKAGHPLKKSTTELEIPARPIFEPMESNIRKDLPPFIETKVKEYIAGIEHKSARNRREYKVYK